MVDVKNKESEEILRLSEEVIKYSKDNDINLPDWWDASNSRKIEIIEKLEDQFNTPEYHIYEKVEESRKILEDTVK